MAPKTSVPVPSLREQLKQATRTRLENCALQLLARQGYQATTVNQIVELAGTTRTTFYDYYKSKSDLIHMVQERYIAPALVRLCEALDALSPITRDSLRLWVDDYARTWERIHVFFEAYGDAARTDAVVAATILPNSYAVTGHTAKLLARYEGEERQRVHDQLVLMFTNLDHLMFQVQLLDDQVAAGRLLDAFTDLYWRGLFAPVRRAPARAR